MPYVRRRRVARRRPMSRRRPRMSRRRSIYRPRRLISNPKIHHFKRTLLTSTITGSTVDLGGVQTLYFSDLPNYTEFTNLFDMFRINKVVTKFIPLSDEANVGTQSTTLFYTYLDYNDGTTPVSESEVCQYDTLRISQGLKQHVRIYTPCMLAGVSNPVTVAKPEWKQWYNCANATAIYFNALKYWRPAQPTGQLVNYKIVTTVYFSCRSVK